MDIENYKIYRYAGGVLFAQTFQTWQEKEDKTNTEEEFKLLFKKTEKDCSLKNIVNIIRDLCNYDKEFGLDHNVNNIMARAGMGIRLDDVISLAQTEWNTSEVLKNYLENFYNFESWLILRKLNEEYDSADLGKALFMDRNYYMKCLTLQRFIPVAVCNAMRNAKIGDTFDEDYPYRVHDILEDQDYKQKATDFSGWDKLKEKQEN